MYIYLNPESKTYWRIQGVLQLKAIVSKHVPKVILVYINIFYLKMNRLPDIQGLPKLGSNIFPVYSKSKNRKKKIL